MVGHLADCTPNPELVDELCRVNSSAIRADHEWRNRLVSIIEGDDPTIRKEGDLSMRKSNRPVDPFDFSFRSSPDRVASEFIPPPVHDPRDPDDDQNFWFPLVAIVGCVIAASILLGLGYVVVHFVIKFW